MKPFVRSAVSPPAKFPAKHQPPPLRSLSTIIPSPLRPFFLKFQQAFKRRIQISKFVNQSFHLLISSSHLIFSFHLFISSIHFVYSSRLFISFIHLIYSSHLLIPSRLSCINKFSRLVPVRRTY